MIVCGYGGGAETPKGGWGVNGKRQGKGGKAGRSVVVVRTEGPSIKVHAGACLHDEAVCE